MPAVFRSQLILASTDMDEVYSQWMPGKVTLYVRDEHLWSRARAWSGRGGLSEFVDQCLREWLDRQADTPEPTVLERARRLLAEAEALVAAVERNAGVGAPSGGGTRGGRKARTR